MLTRVPGRRRCHNQARERYLQRILFCCPKGVDFVHGFTAFPCAARVLRAVSRLVPKPANVHRDLAGVVASPESDAPTIVLDMLRVVGHIYLRMPAAVRLTLIVLSLAFMAVGGYHRVQSQRSGERLDRTKEGWPILIGIRLLGLLTVGSTAAWLWRPEWFQWASRPISSDLRWIGVAGFACAVAWLMWMFRALGRNLTDTVVTRRDAHFVDQGLYRFVRNPMYTGS
jgi:Phospholipid methyltransferase